MIHTGTLVRQTNLFWRLPYRYDDYNCKTILSGLFKIIYLSHCILHIAICLVIWCPYGNCGTILHLSKENIAEFWHYGCSF